MNVKSILIALGICVLMFGAGFGATTVIRGIYGNVGGGGEVSTGGGAYSGMEMTDLTPTAPPAIPEPAKPVSQIQTGEMDNDSVEQATPVEQTSTIEIERVEGPSFLVRSRMYSATVYVKGIADDGSEIIYELYNDGNELISNDNSSKLIIPQSLSGVYFVTIRNSDTGERSKPYEITGCVIQRMEKSRLEQICNSGDYTTMRNMEAYELSSSLTLEFSGVSEDEDVATSIDDICTRISLGIWSSVSVVDIRYDSLNRIEFVKFKVEE